MGKVKILRASAGSGKTYSLVGEYLAAVVGDPALYRHILAVTFTNKATEEMKERILRELHALARGTSDSYVAQLTRDTGLGEGEIRGNASRALGNILHDYSRFNVMTIDRFFQSVIRSFLRELGINPDFALELKNDTLLERAADAVIERSSTDEGLKEWIGDFVGERLEEGAAWDVRGKLAAAGQATLGENWREHSGQRGLREILGRTVERITSERDKAVREIEAAAGRALELIDDNFLTPDDFVYGKSGVAGFLVRTARGEMADYREKVRVMKALGSDNADGWAKKKSASEKRIEALAPELQKHLAAVCALWDEHRKLINSVALVRRRFRSYGLLDEISGEVTRLCAEQNIVPIWETTRILHGLVEGNDAPFIYEKTGNRYSRFMIDEFQDTSRAQWDNFAPLLGNALSQSDREPVLLVGDVKQSIYRWRGGDWRILAAEVEKRFGAPVERDLETNYRSLERIVRFNNLAMAGCVSADSENLAATLRKAQEEGYIEAGEAEELAAMLPSAYRGLEQKPKPGNGGGYVTLTVRPPTPEGEADLMIKRVEDLQDRGYGAGDIAILVRTNAEAAEAAAMLLDRKAANPGSHYRYDVVTAEGLRIGSSPAVRFIAACLGMAAGPEDPLDRAAWNLHFGAGFHEDIPPEEKGFINSLRLCPPQEALHKVLIRYNIEAAADQLAYVQAFHEQLLRFCNANIADLPLFLDWWREKGADEAVYMPSGGRAIRIITIHKAKGLEFPAVIIPDCSWGLAPRPGSTFWSSCEGTPMEEVDYVAVGHEKSAAQSWFSEGYYRELVSSHVDNVNLLYVAMTRAERELHILAPLTKEGKEITTAADLLTRAAEGMDGAVRHDDGQTSIMEFGSPTPPPVTGEAEGRVHTGYPTHEAGLRVRLRLPSQRYFEDGDSTPELSPRSYGMLMHKVFGNASDERELRASLAALRQQGSVSQAEAGRLEALIAKALRDERIASWFGGGWQTVRNENDIVVPGAGGRRPDRVMIRGEEAVVVDYKFGEKQLGEHRSQVKQYMKLLKDMGYGKVAGYLWYVAQDKVIEV